MEQTLGGIREGDSNGSADHSLGNGYAIKGVEFSYLRVADIVTFTESGGDQHPDYNQAMVLYGFDKEKSADLLAAIGLGEGAGRYKNADSTDKLASTNYYYTSDVLNKALAANATTVKNALETFITANGGTAMELTNEYGMTKAEDMDLGLFLFCETKLPEMVTTSCNPFLLSIPMSDVVGGNSTDGGTRWIYDITLYPKNLTGIPSLEKTLRESKADTGKHNGSTNNILDGYAYTGTASDGDVIDYQLVSTLPSITSKASYLTEYTFIDTLSAGLEYNKNDVVVEFFSDSACNDLITTWRGSDGKFKVTYGTADNNATTMTIEMTAQGLAEINTAKTVYTGASMINSGYSDCTIRITYAATMHSDDSVIYGDSGNPNEVVLLWRRSSQDYYDTLVDDAHTFVYALELTKLFSDGLGDYANVEFIVRNDTDRYYVQAELNEAEGAYYVTGYTDDEAQATHFVPVIPVIMPTGTSKPTGSKQ